MTTQTEALELAFDLANMHHTDYGYLELRSKVRQLAKQALAHPEQEVCEGCDGIGVVGNILDTDTCPFCKGSGVEAQPEQEPVGEILLTNGDYKEVSWKKGKLPPVGSKLYTTQQRKPLTDEQIADMWQQYNPLCGIASFARAIEAAHGIKE